MNIYIIVVIYTPYTARIVLFWQQHCHENGKEVRGGSRGRKQLAKSNYLL